ncbi:MAG: winged helix-turn-helix domain-containing protein [Actinomycetota bacterium]
MLVVFDAPAHLADLMLAIQAAGVPCPLAADDVMLEYWQDTGQPAGFLVDLGCPWIREAASRLLGRGAFVIGLSDEEEVRIRTICDGFDDAWPMSMQPREIAARLVARLRLLDPALLPADPPSGPLRVDVGAQRVWWWDQERHLSRILFELAAHLAARPGKRVPLDTLLRVVWREPWNRDTNKVQKAIGRFREALGPDAGMYIRCARGLGVGYFPE